MIAAAREQIVATTHRICHDESGGGLQQPAWMRHQIGPAIIEAEPALARWVEGERLDAVLEAMADLADLKSPYFAGHSRGVANLAAAAGRNWGLREAEVVVLTSGAAS